MSVQAMTWAYEQDLPLAPKFLLVTLANYADADGYCFPGQVQLALDIGVTDRSVRTWIKWLEATGYVSRKRRYRTTGSRSSDGYTLLFEGNRKNFPVAVEP